jgi:hypothetical protein
MDEGVETFSHDLGTGLEGSPVTLAALSAAMPAGFTLTITGYSSEPAAFILNTPTTSVAAGGSVSIDYYKKTDIDLGDAAGYTSFTHANTSDEFKNVSFAQLNNVLYISNGKDEVLKYDGARVYRAGLPNTPAITSLVTKGSGTSKESGKKYDYIYVYEFEDGKGNTISSERSAVKTYEQGSNTHDIKINLPVFPATGFDFVSTNIKIKIYRSAAYDTVTPTLYYHLTGKDQTVSDETSTYLNIEDNLTDGGINNLNNAYKTRIKRQDPPPKGSYLTTFKDCLVIAGQPTDSSAGTSANNVSYSLPFSGSTLEIGSEYFPDDDNSVIVNSQFGTKITAIAPLRDLLYIFHENTIHVLAGDISDPSGVPFTVDLLTNEGGLGCISHHSITEFENKLVFLSTKGMYSIDSSNALLDLSSLIKPVFNDTSLVKKRAVTFNWTDKDLLVTIIPKEETKTGQLVTTSNSLVIAFDYYRQAWLQWDSLDLSAGMTLYSNKVVFLSRGETNKKLNIFNYNNDTTDYADHTAAINFEYDTNWESLGEPTVPKKFLRLKVHSFDTEENFESPSFDLDIKIQKDYNPVDLGNINFNFGGTGPTGGWGISAWGTSGWGALPRKFVKSKLPTGKHKCTKLRFTNDTLNENVLITNYEFEVAVPYQTEIKD